MTIEEATEKWVDGFNEIRTDMIRKLMQTDPDDWNEVTAVTVGDDVYVYDVPEGLDTLEHSGTIESYDSESDLYTVELRDGETLSLSEDDFELECERSLPMWGSMWSFGNSADDYWLEHGGIQLMSDCGFRIFESDEFGYFFGIDGMGYSFFREHFIPLYKARGLQWHESQE